MNKIKTFLQAEPWVSTILLILTSAAVYLPLVGQIRDTNDDWYLMYSARVAGPGIFQAIFSVDRPMRAFVLGPAYALFGQHVILYNLSAWAFRVAGALLLLWLLRMLWPGQAKATFAMSLLYLLYPGFLSQLNGIDYQSQMISMAAAMLSIGLSIRAFSEPRRGLRLAWMGLAILLGWVYLGLVEYEAGFEFLRLGFIFILVARGVPGLRARVLAALKAWLPYALIPLAFGVWRLFFFQTDRKATDLGVQLSGLAASPLRTLLGWASRLFLDTLNILVSAWGVPLYQISARVGVFDVLVGVVLGVLFSGLALLALVRMPDEQPVSPATTDWRLEAIALGLAGVVVALVPVVLANRQVEFPDYSRYTLVSSVGAVLAIVAGLHFLADRRVRYGLLAFLALVACVTQYTNGALAAAETASMDAFWWQVAWRIPQLGTNTTLIAHYPVVSIQEDYFVWGPANLLYYPEQVANVDYIQPALYAAVPNDDTVQKVLMRQRQEYDKRRSIRTYANYRNILILTQPTTASCVQVIDGAQPELSSSETAAFIAMAPHSEADHIQLDQAFHTPPQDVFGAEPAHAWCYLYEKAALARQRGDWPTVASLGDQAFAQKLSPSDLIEWMPFLEAYARLGNADRLAQIAPTLAAQPFVQFQACQVLGKLSGLHADVQAHIQPLFCPTP